MAKKCEIGTEVTEQYTNDTEDVTIPTKFTVDKT